ncbi:unnamed protein product [Rotaria sp. Silwood2]|nr:unnamed protein product [Rotaria sp. Silwood2]CAF2681753.1 unnamed protein product [Rotaria sp. Silwood2]CAF4006208.1 unnamed protein product [Rotaria sp. Silwood2]CAF4508285.1 unnamed protein product [Rotaria sp. Silwood2]
MQALWQYILIVAIFTVAYGKFETKNIQSISSGLSFGMCRGYCQQSINVTSNPLRIVATKEANFVQKPYPPIRQPFPFSSNQWEELISLLNVNVFEALGDTVGCPDCADGGAEWIQVNWTEGSKRVTFENGRAIKGIEELIGKLRQLRQEYGNQI